MKLFNQRDGILSLADARRDANLSRVGARDQYESDVADFKDSFVTDLENDFMSSDNTFMNPLYMPPSVSLDIPPMENIYDTAINTPTKAPSERSGFFGNLMDSIYGQIYDSDEFNIADDGYTGFIGGLINDIQDEIGDDNIPYDPPQDLPQDPPVNTPAPRPMYKPPTDFSSGAPALNMAITPREFGTTPGFEPPPPLVIDPQPPGGGGGPIGGPPPMCFVAGTKVDMADGTKKVIENIVIGDKVLALNGKTDVVSYVHDIPKADRNLWTINDRITATDAHAFLTKDGWKSNNAKLSNTVYNDYGIEVKDLEIGDKLITDNGVEEVTKLENEKDFVKVYNFTTSNTHTYMVDGVVSHNKLPPGGGGGPRLFVAEEDRGMKFGGALNAGIMRLPQSQQGDTMTTRIFQNAFKPRR